MSCDVFKKGTYRELLQEIKRNGGMWKTKQNWRMFGIDFYNEFTSLFNPVSAANV